MKTLEELPRAIGVTCDACGKKFVLRDDMATHTRKTGHQVFTRVK